MATQRRGTPSSGAKSEAPQNNGASRQPPVHECRIGRIKGAVWANEGKEGTWYSVTIVRNYKDGQGNWKTATSYGKDDLLVVAEVSRLCFLFIAQQNGTDLGGKEGNGSSGGDESDFNDRF